MSSEVRVNEDSVERRYVMIRGGDGKVMSFETSYLLMMDILPGRGR